MKERRESRFDELDRLIAAEKKLSPAVQRAIEKPERNLERHIDLNGLPDAAIAQHRRVGPKKNHPLLTPYQRRRVYLAETGRL